MQFCELYMVFIILLVQLSQAQNKKSDIGEPCTYKTDCRRQFSYCYNREKCACNKNYTLNPTSGQCVPGCFSDTGCPGGGKICMSISCKCDKYFIALNQECVKQDKVRLGGICSDTEDCLETNTSKVQCLNGVCTCGNGYRHIGRDICLPGYLGARCNTSYQCQPLNDSTHCYNQKCQCKDNYVISENRKSCLAIVKLEKRCEEHQQCIANNSECIHSKCQCKSGYRIENYNCVRSIDLGENCTTSKECNPLFGVTHCNKGVCDCRAPEYIKSTRRHNSCLKVSEYAMYCEEISQCPGNSTCMKGQCTCEESYYWNNNACEPNSAHLVRGNLWTMFIILLTFYLF